MDGKHTDAVAPKSKKGLIITLSVIIAALLGVSGFFVFKALQPEKKKTPEKMPLYTVATADSPVVTSADTTPKESNDLPAHPPTTDTVMDTEEPQTHSEHIAIPTEGGEITYFNGTYIPSGEAEDLSTAAVVSPREVFGQSYATGTITFNDNGTFADTLSESGTQSGEYLVENGQIKATYYPDRNMFITVTEWNDKTKAPAAFYIVYGEEATGVKVCFKEN